MACQSSPNVAMPSVENLKAKTDRTFQEMLDTTLEAIRALSPLAPSYMEEVQEMTVQLKRVCAGMHAYYAYFAPENTPSILERVSVPERPPVDIAVVDAPKTETCTNHECASVASPIDIDAFKDHLYAKRVFVWLQQQYPSDSKEAISERLREYILMVAPFVVNPDDEEYPAYLQRVRAWGQKLHPTFTEAGGIARFVVDMSTPPPYVAVKVSIKKKAMINKEIVEIIRHNSDHRISTTDCDSIIAAYGMAETESEAKALYDLLSNPERKSERDELWHSPSTDQDYVTQGEKINAYLRAYQPGIVLKIKDKNGKFISPLLQKAGLYWYTLSQKDEELYGISEPDPTPEPVSEPTPEPAPVSEPEPEKPNRSSRRRGSALRRKPSSGTVVSLNNDGDAIW